uniref:Uncharacterized protein n=1 Tax=Candidatus Kentrum sp. DK TaxID=2126562 RepID=A0A450SSN8_9GAMM|nr:MAG: hypothetical protein BECKDK2373C_GA0170839_105719 [Candidatus Kentron sp. DK]
MERGTKNNGQHIDELIGFDLLARPLAATQNTNHENQKKKRSTRITEKRKTALSVFSVILVDYASSTSP